LSNNQRLHRHLGENMRKSWAQTENGLLLPSLALPFDSDQLTSWAGYIAKALILHHWQELLPTDYDSFPFCLSRSGEAVLGKFFLAHPMNVVSNDLGDGTILYRGVHFENLTTSYWEIIPFGGVLLGEDPGAPNEVSTRISVFTGPKSLNIQSYLK